MFSPRAFGRSLVLAVVALVAAAVPVSAQATREGGPVVGPEAPVARPVPGQPREASEQAVAYGSGVFLVVWTDARRGVRVTRVDRNGAVVDPVGILLASEPATSPAVAFDGTNFLVVWDGPSSIRGLRVSPGGAVLDPAPIELSSAPGATPAVSAGGGNYLVVWTDHDDAGGGEGDVLGARLSSAGVVLEPTDLLLVAAEDRAWHVDIAFNGTHHLLVWGDLASEPFSANVAATLVTTEGVALGPGTPLSTADGHRWMPAVTSTGSGFFVAWEDERGPEHHELYGTRVGADGSVLDEAGIRIAGSEYSDRPLPPHVSWDGVNTLVLRQTGGSREEQVWSARVDPSGTVLDPDGVVLASGRGPASAFDGTRHLLTTLGPADDRLTGTRVTRDLVPLDPGGFGISFAANEQAEIDMVSDGVNDFVVWSDTRSGRRAVYGARVGPDGQNLDGTGFLISTPDSTLSTGGVSVAFDGTNFFVLWSEWSEWPEQHGAATRAALVSRTGEIGQRFDISTDEAFGAPTVAYGNGMYLIFWSRWEVYYSLMVTRVGSDGTVLDPDGIPLGNSYVRGPTNMDIAAGASEFLVVWNHGQHEDGDDNDVFGAVVTTAGTVAASTIRVADEPFPVHENHPAVAWHDGTFLVVWSRLVLGDTSPDDEADIHGARVDATGEVLDPTPLPISTATGLQEQPEIAVNGRFLVTWSDRRRRADFSDPAADLYGTMVELDWSVGSEFLIAATDTYSYSGASTVSAVPGSDDFAVAYGRYLPESPYGTTRTFIRRVSPK